VIIHTVVEADPSCIDDLVDRITHFTILHNHVTVENAVVVHTKMNESTAPYAIYVLYVESSAADHEDAKAERTVSDSCIMHALVRVKTIEIAVIHNDVTAEVATHNTVVHKSIGYNLTGLLIFVLSEIEEGNVYAIRGVNIVAAHLVADISLLVSCRALEEAIRLMPLNLAVGEFYVIAFYKGKEAGIRYTVGLVRTPLVNNAVTVTVDLDCHILTVVTVHDIVNGGIRSLNE
jgi:hypothetical protein